LFGSEERFGVERGLIAANSAKFELVTTHRDADASFDPGGELSQEISAMLRGELGAIAEVGHLGGGEGFDFGVDGCDVLVGLSDLVAET
jgi:hypothetical protein